MVVSVGRLLVDFSMWCTIACLNRIVTSGRIIAAIFTLIFFSMLFLFFFISMNCVLKYVKYPSSTDLSINIHLDASLSEISELLAQFESGEQNNNGTADSAMLRLRRAQIMLRLFSNKLSNETRMKAGYSFSELVTECTIAGKTCTSTDFTSFLHPDYGVCFTFNSDQEITRPGLGQGLRLLMTVNQDSPLASRFDFLPTTDSTAIWAVIHNENEFPDFDKNGFRVGAASQALVSLTKTDHSRLSSPYGSYTDKATDTYEEYAYSMNGCQHECMQKLATERCGCVDPLFRKTTDQRYCENEKEADCLLSLPFSISSPTIISSLCDCTPVCTEELFEKVVSSSNFPSSKYKVATGTQQQRNTLLGDQGGGRKGERDDNSDDYDAPFTTSTTLTRTRMSPEYASTTVNEHSSVPSASTSTVFPSMTTSSTSSTTTSGVPQVCPPEDLSVLDVTSLACRAAYSDIYSNPSLTVIQGWPCLSIKRCKSCIMAADPSTPWPCSYSDYQVCTEKNNVGSTKYSCAIFFDAFDFIPAGVLVPNITNWANGTNPSSTTSCSSFASGTQAFNNCWVTHECSTIPSSSNLSTLLDQTNPLIDRDFLKTIPAGISPCDFSKSASTAAINKFSSGGRRKRQATAVDLPGFGSCEYANKNFKNAADCIAWYRRNALLLHVFYEQLQVNNYEQGASYTLVSLISDISGHAGLWLGISVVSMVEILSLFVMIISNFVCGKNIVIDRDNVEREAEKRNERESREINSARV